MPGGEDAAQQWPADPVKDLADRHASGSTARPSGPTLDEDEQISIKDRRGHFGDRHGAHEAQQGEGLAKMTALGTAPLQGAWRSSHLRGLPEPEPPLRRLHPRPEQRAVPAVFFHQLAPIRSYGRHRDLPVGHVARRVHREAPLVDQAAQDRDREARPRLPLPPVVEDHGAGNAVLSLDARVGQMWPKYAVIACMVGREHEGAGCETLADGVVDLGPQARVDRRSCLIESVATY
jgi:hypothetical protein